MASPLLRSLKCSAKKMYQEALNDVLPIQTVALLREQSMKVLDAHDRVRSLERATTRG